MKTKDKTGKKAEEKVMIDRLSPLTDVCFGKKRKLLLLGIFI